MNLKLKLDFEKEAIRRSTNKKDLDLNGDWISSRKNILYNLFRMRYLAAVQKIADKK